MGAHAGGRRASAQGPTRCSGAAAVTRQRTPSPGKPPRPQASAQLVRRGRREESGRPAGPEGGRPEADRRELRRLSLGPRGAEPPPAARTPGPAPSPAEQQTSGGSGKAPGSRASPEPAKAVAEAAAGERCGKAPPHRPWPPPSAQKTALTYASATASTGLTSHGSGRQSRGRGSRPAAPGTRKGPREGPRPEASKSRALSFKACGETRRKHSPLEKFRHPGTDVK